MPGMASVGVGIIQAAASTPQVFVGRVGVDGDAMGIWSMVPSILALPGHV